MGDVLVVGCGLLGASIGLALRGSDLGDVLLADQDDVAVSVAVDRGAGRRWDGEERVALAVVAVPPAATPEVLIGLQRRDLARTYTHVSSVQSHVQAEVERLSPDPSHIVGGHPLAGREVSGPQGALADLFVGRPWAVCPAAEADPGAVDDVERLAGVCGAVPVRVSPQHHDAAVALLSHLPQVVSSALAGRLAEDDDTPGLALELSGPGLADTTRLAASNAHLWTEILVANAALVAPHLRAVSRDLASLAEALDALSDVSTDARSTDRESATGAVDAFLRRGNAGRARVPVKRGELAGAFSGVRVELDDEPGQLARLFVAAGEAGVNVEDVRVEHVPGRQRGVIELLVAPGAQGRLRAALGDAGWHVFMST
jgi:prephenate dehydrogenase